MRFLITFVFSIAITFSLLHAKDFMGIPIEESISESKQVLPKWIMGGGVFARYYVNSFDAGLKTSIDYRIHKNHSLGFMGLFHFGDDLYELGIDNKFYFSGSLMHFGSEDFLKLGLSILFMEKHEKLFYPPVVSIGYGRDFLFFKKANFMSRVEISGRYILGEPVSKNEKKNFMEQEGHLIVSLDFSILFF